MKAKFLQLLFCLCVLSIPEMLRAQNFSGHQWHFGGSGQGIRFSRSDNSASLVSQAFLSTGGSAVMSDPTNGNLIFYTSGAAIFDASHNVMPNGPLNGDPTDNQPVVVAKVPGSTTQYFVITKSGTGVVEYSTVDMTLPGSAIFPTPAMGDVMNPKNNATGLTGRSEAMITVPHSNGTDFWLITHQNGTANYTVTLFTAAGPGTSTSFNNLGLITSAGNFAYHAGTGRIAVSPTESTRDVEVLNFDNASGALSFNRRILSSGVTTTSSPAVYDTEWSSSGDFLYISRTGDAGVQAQVLQYDFASTNPSISLNPVLPSSPTIFRSYGLQMAPDSAIYHLYQTTSGGPYLLGKIEDTDTIAVDYTAQAFPGNFNARQFPSFAPASNLNLTVSFVADGLCANAPTSFYPTVSPGADSLRWDFVDGNTSSEWSPIHTYEAGSTYNVTVTAYLNGQSVTSPPTPVQIIDFDTQINLVQDTTACTCELPTPGPLTCTRFSVTAQVSGTGSPQLQWFGPGGPIPGANSATLQPDSAGYYYLVATVGGCFTYAGVNIKEYDVLDQRANIWYFGDRAGIDFNPLPDNPPVAISNPVMNAPEGTATISDRNGQVIFFTDGDKVWNRQNVEIATGIGGDPGSTQAALIIPVPGDETLYYIFTTQEVHGSYGYELRYSLFDLKMNGGTGGLVEQNVLLFSKSTERITGNGGWLIAHEYGNNSFRSYRITADGISNPVISSVGSDHNFASEQNGRGYMELGGNNKIAVALSTQGVSNVVEIFDFVDSTGTVTNLQTANLNSSTGQVYGVEFYGNKLFATLQDGSSKIYEFFLDSLGVPYEVGPPPLSAQTFNEQLGAIQTGPDGAVYVAVNDKPYLGVIQVNGDTTIASTFIPNQFPLAGGTLSKLGLPNFIQTIADPIQGPGLSVAGFCLGDSTNFSGTGTDPIDVYLWQVRQSGTTNVVTSSSEQSFNFLFAAPGDYDVSLRITNRCGLDTTLTQTFTINDVPPDPSGSVVLCTGSQVLDANPGGLPGLTYLWSTGETTQTITVNQQAIYNVTVTNAAGCSTDGSIMAADNRPIVELGPNLTICQNTAIAPLDAQNPGATYAWTINGVASGTTRTQSVNTSVPGTFEYEVTVTDPITTCVVVDAVTFTINASPAFTAPSTPSTCGGSTGTIALTISAPAGTLFSYFITGPTSVPSGIDQAPGAVIPVNGLSSGTYGITVSDQVTGCTTITTSTVNDNAFIVTATPNQACDPIVLDVVVTPTPGPLTFPLNYRVIDRSTLAVVESGTAAAASFATTIPLASNNEQYTVEVTSGTCLAGGDVAVDEDPTVPVTLASDVCASPNISLSVATGGTGWTWTGPNIVGSNTLASIQANPGAGTHTYNVTVTEAGFCALDTALTVVVQTPITASLSQSSACEDQVIVTATPSGSYLYRWYRNGVLDITLGGSQIIETNDNFSYEVAIYNPVTGCTSPRSVPLSVQVDGTLGVTLTSTPPCEGAPFTLTAAPSRPVTSYGWVFNNTPVTDNDPATPATLEATQGGTYAVTVTDANCSATGEIEVIPSPTTPGNMTDVARICPDEANPDPATREAVLDPGDGFISYAWFREGTTLGITTPTLVVTEAGTYEVDLVNTFGCTSSDKTQVIVDCDPVIVGPNAFRPGSALQENGEFVNQAFRLFTFFIDDEGFSIFIFNRWGEMVYQSPDREFRWNGGYNNNLGQLLPAGTYSYVVKYKSSYRPEMGVQEKRGGVVLMR